MAADVTLCSVPDRYVFRRRLEWHMHERVFHDSDVWYDDDGNIDMVAYGDSWGRNQHWIHDHPEFRWLEVGPISFMKAMLDSSDYWLPAPTLAVHQKLREPRVMTPGLRADVMVLFSRPDNSHYKDWGKQKSAASMGMKSHIGWYTRGPRKAKPQHVKRWLGEQYGRIVWAEPW